MICFSGGYLVIHGSFQSSRLSYSVVCLILSPSLVKVSSRVTIMLVDQSNREEQYTYTHTHDRTEQATRRDRKTWSSDSDSYSRTQRQEASSTPSGVRLTTECYKNARCFSHSKLCRWKNVRDLLSVESSQMGKNIVTFDSLHVDTSTRLGILICWCDFHVRQGVVPSQIVA
jgi:hypothetical protein